jgi:Family of unknown function (DUF6069)
VGLPQNMEGPGSPPGPRVDAGRLWMGGVATAVVAALVAVVGVLVARGLFDVAVLAPAGEGAWGDASTATLAGMAAVGALLATGLMHILLLTTPRPWRFFTWIISLVTLAVAITPLLTGEDAATRIATSAIYLAIGVAIGSLMSSVARSAVSVRPDGRSTRYR